MRRTADALRRLIGLDPVTPDPNEVIRLKTQMEQFHELDNVLDVLGQPDDRPPPPDISSAPNPADVRYLCNVHRYWRHWKTLGVDVGVWSDSGELGYVYYARPQKMHKVRL